MYRIRLFELPSYLAACERSLGGGLNTTRCYFHHISSPGNCEEIEDTVCVAFLSANKVLYVYGFWFPPKKGKEEVKFQKAVWVQYSGIVLADRKQVLGGFLRQGEKKFLSPGMGALAKKGNTTSTSLKRNHFEVYVLDGHESSCVVAGT